MLAITRLPSPRMDACELTFVARERIDYELALGQHAGYCQMLRECGADVVTVPASAALPDCAFVEDTAIALDELAVLASMGTASRRGEIEPVASIIEQHRPVVRVELPATLEGGDVLRIGRTLLVGISCRTNQAGCDALERIVRQHGYRVVPVLVRGCLHLKTACTALNDSTLLVNPSWIDLVALGEFEHVAVPADEPWGANVMRIGASLCIAATHRRTAELLDKLGIHVRAVDISQFAKAEAGVTCLSVLVNQPARSIME
jgi:dimethylargininase